MRINAAESKPRHLQASENNNHKNSDSNNNQTPSFCTGIDAYAALQCGHIFFHCLQINTTPVKTVCWKRVWLRHKLHCNTRSSPEIGRVLFGTRMRRKQACVNVCKIDISTLYTILVGRTLCEGHCSSAGMLVSKRT